MSARKPGTVPARGLGAPAPEFIPYAPGERPERVLRSIRAGLRPETILERLGRELAADLRRPGRGGVS